MADYSWVGPAVEAGASIFGRLMAEGDYQKASQLYDQIIQDMDEIEIPKFKELVAQEIAKNREVSMGSSGRTAQQGAIDRLSQLVDEGGLDAQARLDMQQALSAADQQNAANRGAILDSRARRGLGGSGDELAALLGSQQSSANSARDAGLNIAAAARQRALNALEMSGQLAGQMRGQDIGIEKGNADAAMEREMFNAKMRDASARGNNEGAMMEAMARLQKGKAMAQAKGNKSTNLSSNADRTKKDYAAAGRGINTYLQGQQEKK